MQWPHSLPASAAALILSGILTLACTDATAQTFSCEMSHTLDQRAVCADRYLRRLDAIAARQYADLRTHIKHMHASNPARARAWSQDFTALRRRLMAQRAACNDDAACIAKVYEQHIDEILALWKQMLR